MQDCLQNSTVVALVYIMQDCLQNSTVVALSTQSP